MTNKKQETQQKPTKKCKKHLFLNIAISSLALVGSVGTIVFGTLWCKGRNVPAQEDVKLNKTSLTLDVNASEKLFAIVNPIGCSQDVTWSSNNKDVANVDAEGNVLAKSGGTATITAKAVHCDSSATCTVTVQDTPVPPSPETINLDYFEKSEYSDQECFLSCKLGKVIHKDQPIALVTDMKDIEDPVDKSTGLVSYSIGIYDPQSEGYPPTFYKNCEFYIDNTLISPDHYLYASSALEFANFYLIIDPTFPLPVAITEESVFKLVLTPYSELTENIEFLAGYAFNPE